jgi:hypothetical protein
MHLYDGRKPEMSIAGPPIPRLLGGGWRLHKDGSAGIHVVGPFQRGKVGTVEASEFKGRLS